MGMVEERVGDREGERLGEIRERVVGRGKEWSG